MSIRFGPFNHGLLEGSLYPLINRCEEKELIEPQQAALLRKVNSARNRAAHGIMTGEINPADLREEAEQAQWAAVGAVDRLKAWLNNPCKFYWKRDGVPFQPIARENK